MIQSIDMKIFDVLKELSVICNPLKLRLRSHSWSWPNIENEQMVKWPNQLSSDSSLSSNAIPIIQFYSRNSASGLMAYFGLVESINYFWSKSLSLRSNHKVWVI